jgi:hypothetical protein
MEKNKLSFLIKRTLKLAAEVIMLKEKCRLEKKNIKLTFYV